MIRAGADSKYLKHRYLGHCATRYAIITWSVCLYLTFLLDSCISFRRREPSCLPACLFRQPGDIHSSPMLFLPVHLGRCSLPQLYRLPSFQHRLRMLPQQRTVMGHLRESERYADKTSIIFPVLYQQCVRQFRSKLILSIDVKNVFNVFYFAQRF